MSPSLFGTPLAEIGGPAFGRLFERILWHMGFTEVSNVDGSGDGGIDIVCLYGQDRWLFQLKTKRRGTVGRDAVEELLHGLREYDGKRGAVVTNRDFSRDAKRRIEDLNRDTQNRLKLVGREDLLAFDDECSTRFGELELRPYQQDAFECARSDIQNHHQAFLALATGLGKTVIAGAVIDWYLAKNPDAKVLVLAHTRELVNQLERSLWRHIPKAVPTQQLSGDESPDLLHGLTIASRQKAISYIKQGFCPDFIFIDEAHHVGETGEYAEILAMCDDAARLGVSATPWRGDSYDVGNQFGEPSMAIGIEEGMRLGFLSKVDYNLYVDNIDWNNVKQLSKNDYSIAELNKSLFLPQRDEKIRDELLEVWNRTREPRGIVFCASIAHAEVLLRSLKGVPVWSQARCIHNRMNKRERLQALTRFRLGDVPLLLAVDVLNEGVDVPDVNIVCFARVTHSRRIFIQQLGRGLRLSPGKSVVTVLDFVSDLRRAKAALDLRQNVIHDTQETVFLPGQQHSITFSNQKAESFLEEWLADAADLDTAADEHRLNFPPFAGP